MIDAWRTGRKWVVGIAVGTLGALLVAGGAHAQDQFGGQSRADAASRMIVLGVQQGISSLPPTSGQSFTYEFDPKLDTYVASNRLGPTSFRTPQTIGEGKLSVRLAVSYFELADSLGPIPYAIELNEPRAGEAPQRIKGLAELGLNADAKVGLMNVGATYGIGPKLDFTFNLPIVIVDAQASNVFTTLDPPTTSPDMAQIGGPFATSDNPLPPNGTTSFTDDNGNSLLPTLTNGLNTGLSDGNVRIRTDSFSASGFDFNDGTHAGIGRISIGAKAVLYGGKRFQVAAMPEFFFPSPNQGEFAGSDTAAIFPRLVAGMTVIDLLRLHTDVGYDYDFDVDELRRFVWNVGASVPMAHITFDFGFGGSKFNKGIKWTPDSATFVSSFTDDAGQPISGVITALGDNTLGSNFVDFLGGVKVRVAERSVISGAVNVPVNNEGFRAAAVGTLAFEQYFY